MEEPGLKLRGIRLDWRKATDWAWRILVVVVAVALLVIITTRWNQWIGRKGWQWTDDAYLQADVTRITAKVPGYITAVPVRDYQRVRAGQLIAQVEEIDYLAELQRAQADVGTAKAQVEVLKAQRALQAANVDAAKANYAATAANLAQNLRDLARQIKLLSTGSSTVEAGERLRTTHDQLTAQLDQNRAQVVAAQRQLDVLAAQQAQAEATVVARQADLETAKINLDYTHIIAPQGGQITTLTPLPHVWVLANYRETQLTHMAVGQRAEIRVDTFPGRVMKGHVQSFSPASGAVFALLPPDNATGNFTKIVQRITVKILIDDPDGLRDLLRPGMSVEARIDSREPLPPPSRGRAPPPVAPESDYAVTSAPKRLDQTTPVAPGGDGQTAPVAPEGGAQARRAAPAAPAPAPRD
jgi:membrane fusion protein (multidrug efflux system)